MHFKELILLGALGLSLAAAPAADIRSAPRTFKIGSATEIQVDGAEAPASALKVGLHATVLPDTFQDGYAASIDAHTASAKGGAQIDGAAKAPPGPVKQGDHWVQAPPPPQAVVSSLPPPASTAKYWVITAVTADSITVSYK